MIEMGTDHDILVGPFSGNHSQHVGHLKRTVCQLLQLGDGIGMYLPAAFLLSFLGTSLEGLIIGISVKRRDTGLLKTGNQIAGSHARTGHTGFTSLQGIVCQKTYDGFSRRSVNTLQAFFHGGLCLQERGTA